MDASLVRSDPRALLAQAYRALDAASTLPEIASLVDQAEVVRVAARKARLGREAQNDWAVVRLEAVRKAGHVLAEMRADGRLASGRGGDRTSFNTTLIEALDAPTHQAAWERARRWQALAAWPEGDFRAWLRAVRDGDGADGGEAGEVSEAAALRAVESRCDYRGLFLSDETNWLTPRPVLERAVATLGEIDLDPCSNSRADPRVPARCHYTVEDDGLAQPWFGRVYMNPPYGKAVGLWVAKLAGEIDAGRVIEAVTLVSARTDTAWWRALPARLVCFPAGRLTFSDADAPAPFPSAIAYEGPNPDAFVSAFAPLGPVYLPVARGVVTA